MIPETIRGIINSNILITVNGIFVVLFYSDFINCVTVWNTKLRANTKPGVYLYWVKKIHPPLIYVWIISQLILHYFVNFPELCWFHFCLIIRHFIEWWCACCRYFLRVTIVRRLSDMVKELDIVVHTLSCYPDMNNSIKMEVGIEDCLHIEFEYNKSKWGIIWFLCFLGCLPSADLGHKFDSEQGICVLSLCAEEGFLLD